MHTDTHTHAQGIVRVSVIFRGSAINYPRERKYIPEKKKKEVVTLFERCVLEHLLTFLDRMFMEVVLLTV